MTLVCLVGPSGVGKTTLGDRLQQIDPSCRWVRTYTTRETRDTEIALSGRITVTSQDMEVLAEENLLATVTRQYRSVYGTSREDIVVALRPGLPVYLLDFAPKNIGFLDELKGDKILVLVLPPDIATLDKRLTQNYREHRTQEAHESLQECMDIVRSGWAKKPGCFVLINNTIQHSITNLQSIIDLHRFKRGKNE